MKNLVLALLTLGSISSSFASEYYIPKTAQQVNQLFAATSESLKYVSLKSYEGQSNKNIQNKIEIFMDNAELSQTVSFMVNAESERFVSCNGRVVNTITEDMLQFESDSYDGFLSDVLESNPNAKAPLVLMGCHEFSTDTNIIDGDFVGRVLFELDEAGNIKSLLKD